MKYITYLEYSKMFSTFSFFSNGHRVFTLQCLQISKLKLVHNIFIYIKYYDYLTLHLTYALTNLKYRKILFECFKMKKTQFF